MIFHKNSHAPAPQTAPAANKNDNGAVTPTCISGRYTMPNRENKRHTVQRRCIALEGF